MSQSISQSTVPKSILSSGEKSPNVRKNRVKFNIETRTHTSQKTRQPDLDTAKTNIEQNQNNQQLLRSASVVQPITNKNAPRPSIVAYRRLKMYFFIRNCEKRDYKLNVGRNETTDEGKVREIIEVKDLEKWEQRHKVNSLSIFSDIDKARFLYI